MSTYDNLRRNEESEENEPNSTSHKQIPSEDSNPLTPSSQLDNSTFLRSYVATQQSHAVFSRLYREKFRQFLLTIALPIIAFFVGWFGQLAFTTSFNTSSQSQFYAHLTQQAWEDIDQNYVDRKAVNYRHMSYQAIHAMLDTLGDNRHTIFLTPAEVQILKQNLSSRLMGIGIYLRQEQGTKQIVITSTIFGSPAEKAGLKRGDYVIAVNDMNTIGKDPATVLSLIHLATHKSIAITITVQRPSTQQRLAVRVTGPEIIEPYVYLHYIAENHIAHIQIVQFASGVAAQLKDALFEAKKLGATSIILDLRDNFGGYVQEAVDSASEFMTHVNVLLVQNSKAQRTPYPVSGKAMDTSIPIVELVNNSTASAAEIITGALQDNNRALIVGTTTYGTDTVLQEFDLADGSAMLLATGEWLTPKGHSRGLGITPNIEVALSAKVIPLTPNDENTAHMTEQQILHSEDRQMVVAIQYLETHQAKSSKSFQGKLSQQYPQAFGLLALEPSFFLGRD